MAESIQTVITNHILAVMPPGFWGLGAQPLFHQKGLRGQVCSFLS